MLRSLKLCGTLRNTSLTILVPQQFCTPIPLLSHSHPVHIIQYRDPPKDETCLVHSRTSNVSFRGGGLMATEICQYLTQIGRCYFDSWTSMSHLEGGISVQ